MSVNQLRDEVVWQRGNQEEGPSPSPVSNKPSMILTIGGVVIGAGALIALVLITASSRSQAAMPPPIAVPPVSACSELNQEIQRVDDLRRAGHVGSAVDVAMVQLNKGDKANCPEAKTLMSLAYNSTLETIFSTPSPDLGQAALTRWRGIEAQGDVYGLPLEARKAPIAVAKQAADLQLWAFARGAFLQAWQSGQVGQGDISVISLYYAWTRNHAGALLRKGDGDSRTQALMLLRTAEQISKLSGSGLGGEAQADLVQMVGPDETTWPQPDRSDPVLNARSKR